MQLIVDVSNNNSSVDFKAVKAAGAVGVWLKVTEGESFVDLTYAARRKQAKAAGLLVGGYHFGHPNDGSSSEVEFFLKHLILEDGDLLPVLDLEEQEVSVAKVHAYAAGFLGALAHHIGEKAVLYCGSYFIKKNGLADLGAKRWIPSYGAPPAFYSWDAWQYTNGTPTYPGAIAHLDTSKAPTLSLLRYKQPKVRKAAAHIHKYVTRFGMRFRVGSKPWKWMKKNRDRLVGIVVRKKT